MRSGNFCFHLRTLGGILVHRGVSQSSKKIHLKGKGVKGIEITSQLDEKNGLFLDYKITQEGLRGMRRRSLVIAEDPLRVWTPARIAKFCQRSQTVCNTSGGQETGNRRKGNIKF